MKQKVTQLSWNIVVTEKPEENAKESSIWEVPQKSTKPINKSSNQASGSVKNKPVNGSSSSNNNGTKEVKNDFENWCMDMLSKMNTAIDSKTIIFVIFSILILLFLLLHSSSCLRELFNRSGKSI